MFIKCLSRKVGVQHSSITSYQSITSIKSDISLSIAGEAKAANYDGGGLLFGDM